MVTKNIGDSATFRSTPGGGPAGTVYTIKFYKSGNTTPIYVPSAGTYDYTKTNLQLSDAGTYYTTTEYTCNIDGSKKGPASSNIETLIVNSIPIPVLTTISISPASASINIGATQQLMAICHDQNNNIMTCPVLTWSSSNSSLATVDSTGKVTGIATGTSNITAKSGTITSNTSIITVSPTTIASITVTNPVTGVSYRHGDSRTIKWKSIGNVGSNVKIVLLKSNTTVKTISSSTKNDGQQSWTVPHVTPGSDYRIKITSTTHSNISGLSGKFTIR